MNYNRFNHKIVCEYTLQISKFEIAYFSSNFNRFFAKGLFEWIVQQASICMSRNFFYLVWFQILTQLKAEFQNINFHIFRPIL